MKFIFVFLLCFCSSGWQNVTSHQEIGDSCTTTTGDKGICKPQTECFELENTSSSNTDSAETCKLHVDGTPIICCIIKTPTAKRDYVSTRNDFTENDFHEISTGNETETRFYTGPRKKPTTYTKNPYDKGTSKAESSKKTQINTKFSDNYDPYGDSFGSPNFISQPSYSEYDSPRPSYGLTNFLYSRNPDTVVFKPSGSSTSNEGYNPSSNSNNNNGYNPTQSTRPNYNGNSGSNNVYNPNQNTRPNGGSTSGSSSNQNTRPNTGSNSYNPSGNTGSNGFNRYPSQNTRPSTGSNSYNPSGNTGSNGYNTNQNSRPSGNNINQNTRPNTGSSTSNGYTPGQNNRPSSGNSGSNGNNFNPNTRPGGSSGNSNVNNGGNIYRPTTSSNDGSIWGSTSRTTTTRTVAGGNNNGGWTSGSQQQKRISEQKCTEYARNVTSTISAVPLSINAQATSHQVQECPFQATGLIVGGTKVNLGEFPHMAALGFKSGNSVVYNCGGTLISEDYVLTAAHCTHSSFGNPVHVRLGDLNLERDDDVQPQIINVASVTVHPNYKAPQLYNDIALIRLARRVPFSKNLRPACLQVKQEISSEKATATGWGSTNYGEISSDDLLKVVLDIIDNSQCNMLYGPDNKLRNGITETMLCAGVLAGKKDTCQGDSGGPLTVHDPNNKCIHYVIGVTSFGKSCGAVNSPGIYTRVSAYISWIEGIVWKNQRI